jgi:hypothetical protein
MLRRFANCNLLFDPAIGDFEALSQRLRRLPAEPFLNKPVIGVAPANSGWAEQIPDAQALAGYIHCQMCKPVDSDRLFGPYVDGSGKGRVHQSPHSLNTLVDVEKRTRLAAIAPDLNLTARISLGNFATNRGRRFFSTIAP